MQQPCKDLLATLPVELLYEIHLFAGSEALPLTCRRLHDVFKNASPTVHADYLITRYTKLPSYHRPSIITYVLRFPLCTPSVLAALLERPSFPHPPVKSSCSTDAHTNTASGTPHANRGKHDSSDYDYASGPPELPRRLFRQLSTSGAEALPHLHFLYTSSAPHLSTPRRRPDIDSHDGYPLARAVAAGAVPLVRFLLDHGASHRRDALAVRMAIKRRDLSLVRLLVEPPDPPPEERRTGKRRKLADRVKVTSEMLRLAVMCGAQDIAEYLMNEKGCVPDIRTLSFLSIMNV